MVDDFFLLPENSKQKALVGKLFSTEFVTFWVFSDTADGIMIAGVKRGSDCTCQGATDDECFACRASWVWYDGSVMNWFKWSPTQPRMLDYAAYDPPFSSKSSHVEFRYMCERGKLPSAVYFILYA